LFELKIIIGQSVLSIEKKLSNEKIRKMAGKNRIKKLNIYSFTV